MHLEAVFDLDDEIGFLYRWFFRRDRIRIDNVIFYLHYHVTILLYFSACLIVTVSMFLMDPIDCISDSSVDEVIDNYCLYHSTYTITGALLRNNRAELVPHPGVANAFLSSRSNSSDRIGNIKFHHYYLWVAPFLLVQTASFYFPRGLWKYWEGSRVSTILKEKTILDSLGEDEDQSRNIGRLASFIASKRHSSYFWKLFLCESLNLINAIVQLYIMDMFLGFDLLQLNGHFLDLLKETRPFERKDSVEQMFPKVTSCTFYAWGPSGNVVNTDALCVLPVNVINEKVFGVLYMWILGILVPLSSIALVYRIITYFLRKPILKQNLLSDFAINEDNNLNYLKKNLPIGNWQLLVSSGWNMETWELTQIVNELFYLKSK